MPESLPTTRRSRLRAALPRRWVILWACTGLLIGEEWLRSYSYRTGLGVVWQNGSQLHTGSCLGELYLRAWRMGDGFTWGRRECLSVGCRRVPSRMPMRGPRPAWFGWYSSGPMPDGVGGFIRNTSVVVPYWPFFWLALACTLWTFRRSYVRVRREREGECIHCSYDLTGNISGVCPECGAAVSGAVPAAKVPQPLA